MKAHPSINRGANQVASALLDWYDAHHRELPWRVPPRDLKLGVRPDPYCIWLSEVMLQQTTVEAVKSYFTAFVEQWPDVFALAAADNSDVMRAWAGLGYYSRARNLKACAETIATQYAGVFPETEEQLRSLPGIGPYTAAAIASIAFNRPAAVVDGNIERVISRLYAIATPLPAAKIEIKQRVTEILPVDRPGDFAQAMMDLGATICSPKRPKCMLCPIKEHCAALANGDPEIYPAKAAKKAKPLRQGAAFIAVRDDGAILLRTRPESGLLGGMSEPPTSDWNSRQDGATTIEAAPFAAKWRPAGAIRHVFTHFELALTVWRADIKELPAVPDAWWSPPEQIPGEALPTVMKKAIEAAIPGATKKRPDRKGTA